MRKGLRGKRLRKRRKWLANFEILKIENLMVKMIPYNMLFMFVLLFNNFQISNFSNFQIA
jgi:hypothetical protein